MAAATPIRKALYLAVMFAFFSTGIFFLSRNGPNSPCLGPQSSQQVDLGEGQPGQLLVGAFLLENTGRQPLRFSLRPSHPFVQVDPIQSVVEPGDFQPVTVRLHLDNDVANAVKIFISTNDPARPSADLDVSARRTVPLRASTSLVDFGIVPFSQSRHIDVTIAGSSAMPPISPSDLIVRADASHLLAHACVGASDEVKVRVSLKSGTSEGILRGMLSIQRRTSNYLLEIPVVADVRPMVMVAPSTLYLTRDPGENGALGATFLVWHADGNALGKLISCRLPEDMTLDDKSESGAKRKTYHLRFSRTRTNKKAFEGILQMKFEGAPELATVRIRSY